VANNLRTVITWKQACDIFQQEHLPHVLRHHYDGSLDMVAAWEAWNNWTDSLCKDGQISDWQYANWSHPPYLEDN